MPSALASEQDFLELVDRHFATRAPGLLLGRGDDCAVFETQGRLCLSTDLFVEGAHFRREYFSPADIGHKALAAAASDLAAMGAKPVGFALSLILPQDVDSLFLDRMLSGMAALATRLGLPLAGGDLSRGALLALDVVVWGRPGQVAGQGNTLLTRTGAQPGDTLVLIGDVGLARAGLHALEALGRDALTRWPACVNAHLRPEPLLVQGLMLAELAGETGGVHALMDVSDGLARDLPRLTGPLGSNMGADLELTQDFAHPEAAAYWASIGEDARIQAVLGGEDYALLAAVAPAAVPELLRQLPQARCIGRVSTEPGLRLNTAPFNQAGFDHFST